MRTLIATLLLLVSTSVLAIGETISHNNNTDWKHSAVAGTTQTGFDEKFLEFAITSKMPNTDISLVYSLIANAETGNGGWALIMRFSEGGLAPTDIHSMEAWYKIDGDWTRMEGWHTDGRDIVIPLSIDNMYAVHQIIDRATVATYEFTYTPKAEVEAAGGQSFDAKKFEMVFDLKNGWDTEYHKLIPSITNAGVDTWLQGTTWMRNQPINTLPEGNKPKPSAMSQAAEQAGVDIDTAYTMSVNDLTKLIQDRALADLKAKKAEEDRLYAIEQAKLAEEARLKALAEEKSKQQEAAKREEALKSARRSIRDFDWPSDSCGSPSRPSVSASDYQVNKANKRNDKWHDCMDESYQDDQRALQRLIDKLSPVGGNWEWTNRAERRWTFSVWTTCECIDMLIGLRDEIFPRHQLRQDAAESFNNWVNNRNDKVASEEMWDGINDSLDQMSRDMDRMYQERQRMQQNQIYITPGYY